MHKKRIRPKNELPLILWDFDIQTDHPMLARQPGLVLINKKKRTCCLVDFAVPTEHILKIKESKDIGKYLNFARELKSCGT